MSDETRETEEAPETCICPPESFRLDCGVHWQIVAAALMREVEKLPTGTTTRKATPRD